MAKTLELRLAAERAKVRERLLKRYTLITATGCWQSPKHKCRDYTTACALGKQWTAHRVSAFAFLEFDISGPLFVLHECDNKRCVNPAHLFFGTCSDNLRDAYQKHLAVPQRSNAKLSEENVQEIRILHGKGMRTGLIAERFRVNRSTIQNILNGKAWYPLPGKLDWEAKLVAEVEKGRER